MVANAPSGMYKCNNCGNIISHHQGKEFEPCAHCANFSWVIIQKDPDYLESALHRKTIHRQDLDC